MPLIYSTQNFTCPGQYSTHPAQNALALASGQGLVSLTVCYWNRASYSWCHWVALSSVNQTKANLITFLAYPVYYIDLNWFESDGTLLVSKGFRCQAAPGDQFNSLRPSDAIWRHRSGSTLAQVMACRLMAPSHYLNHCSLIISKV